MDRRARPLGALLGAILILLLTPALACAASAWPMFGHDAAHSRRSAFVGAQSATLKWAADLVPAAEWIQSSPALAADGTVYITAQDFSAPGQLQLYALDPSTGHVVWHSDAGDAHGSSPAVDPDGYIYLGGDLLSAPASQRGKVFAFSSSGNALWTYSTWSAFYSSPTVAGGAIYIGCDDGNLDSLSPLGDHLNWGAPVNASGELESSPAVDGSGALYVGGAGKMVSLQTASPGTQRWSVPTSGSGLYVQSSPALSNDGTAVYFADDRGTVYARATTDGHELWTYSGLGTVPASSMPSSPGVGADGTVYVGGANGKVYALAGATGAFKWSYSTGGPVFSSPAIGADGTVYVGSDDYRLYALNGATGAFKWSYQTGSRVRSSPAIGADGTLFVGSEDGKLYAIGGGSGPAACSLSTPATSGALKHTVAVTYKGMLTPARVAKVTLTFQKKVAGKWKTVASPQVSTASTGAWTCKKKLAAGAYHLRASTAASAAFTGATSKWKAFVIK